MTHATLTVNLDALAANYHLLRTRHAAGKCAAVVKANAYGLGVEQVSKRLWQEGCRTFFVATLEEALQLRTVLAEAIIYVFQGVLVGEEEVFVEKKLRPVLNSPEQVARWQPIVEKHHHASSALHVDTGMCRLGLSLEELAAIEDTKALVRSANIDLLISHLACASEPDHPLNAVQHTAFEQVRTRFAGLPCSFANSAGHFLESHFHYDMGRPGCSLYGITPTTSNANPMQHVATLTAPILQLREIERDQPVGYGATETIAKGRKLATVALGYADGLHRVASGQGVQGFVGGHAVPMVGRVSMDMTCFDMTDVPAHLLQEQAVVEFINPQQTVDKLADICHTIGYEIFTRLGRRVVRCYSAEATND